MDEAGDVEEHDEDGTEDGEAEARARAASQRVLSRLANLLSSHSRSRSRHFTFSTFSNQPGSHILDLWTTSPRLYDRKGAQESASKGYVDHQGAGLEPYKHAARKLLEKATLFTRQECTCRASSRRSALSARKTRLEGTAGVERVLCGARIGQQQDRAARQLNAKMRISSRTRQRLAMQRLNKL